MKVNKKKLRKILYIYIAVIAVLLFSSKTIYNLSVPKVTVAMPKSGRLVKELEARGTVTFDRTFNIYAPFSGQLENFRVRKGDEVRAHMEIVSYKVNSTDADANVDWGYTIRRVRADSGGVVTTMFAEDGQFVTKGEKIAAVGVNNSKFNVIIRCDESDGAFISLGDGAEIFLQGSAPAAQGIVSEITAEDGAMSVTLSFEAENFSGGEYITAKFQKQTDVYNVLVPSEAVLSDGLSDYVWTVESKEGVLGTEYFSSKVRVFIADSDGYNAAISRGLEYIAPVVVSFDKELTVNGRVNRLE